MKNFNTYSGMNPEKIYSLSIEIRKLLGDHARFIEVTKELTTFLSKVDLLNNFLKDHEILFQAINKEKELSFHIKKSIVASKAINKRIEAIIGISNQDIGVSFEKIDCLLGESIVLIQDKLKLESDFENS